MASRQDVSHDCEKASAGVHGSFTSGASGARLDVAPAPTIQSVGLTQASGRVARKGDIGPLVSRTNEVGLLTTKRHENQETCFALGRDILCSVGVDSAIKGTPKHGSVSPCVWQAVCHGMLQKRRGHGSVEVGEISLQFYA